MTASNLYSGYQLRWAMVDGKIGEDARWNFDEALKLADESLRRLRSHVRAIEIQGPNGETWSDAQIRVLLRRR